MSNLFENFKVESPNVTYSDGEILSKYEYHAPPQAKVENDRVVLTPSSTKYEFKTNTTVPKLGMMIVGLGGNNGTTVTATVLANKLGLSWQKRSKKYEANYFGSVTQSSTIRIGAHEGKDIYVPFKSILPMVDPNDIVIGGWDINSSNLADGMHRADVLDADLQRQLAPEMKDMVPLKSYYDPSFIAANQEERADNVIEGTRQEALEQIRADIRNFKKDNDLDNVIVLWSANTERFADIESGVNDTAEGVLESIKNNSNGIAPSSIFAVASILEKTTFINGSPQNTFVPGVIALAERENVIIAGDDFKSGQTKIKSVLVDFLVSAGIKPVAITSYNHLGNNDGKNLSAPQQFRSKEISKSNVVDDMVESNSILYAPAEHPDHTVVIKYVPTVGDSKRALDEYVSEISMGGYNTIAMHNTCEDSLLAAPIMLDLVIIAELMQRIQWKIEGEEEFKPFASVQAILAYLLKAPLVPEGTTVVNALFRQRAAMENIFRACVGLQPENHMLLEQKTNPSIFRA